MEPLHVENTITLVENTANDTTLDTTLDTNSTPLSTTTSPLDNTINVNEATEDLLVDIPDKPIPGRRDIREIRKESKMACMIRRVVTKKAKQIDARIDDSNDTTTTNESFTINMGHLDDEVPVTIPAFLANHLKPHQLSGVRFLWRCTMMRPVHGGVLAHCMGLGKSFQVITFIYTYLQCLLNTPNIIPDELREGRVVVVCPPTVMNNWIKEFSHWIPEEQRHEMRGLYTIGESGMKLIKLNTIDHWYRNGGVILVSYQFYRDFVMNTRQLNDDKEQTIVERAFLDPGPSVIIADEGHIIKNPRTMIASVFQNVTTKARICLTGSPLQNDLEEYWCMVNWVCPNYLGKLEDFRNRYIHPINNGLFHDSTMSDRKLSQTVLYVLVTILKPIVLRKDATTLRRELPPLHEFVISCRLSPLQYNAYCAYLLEKHRSGATLFQQYQSLLRICNHPYIAQTVRDQLLLKRFEHAKTNPHSNFVMVNPLPCEMEEDEDPGVNTTALLRNIGLEQDLGDHWMKTTIDLQTDVRSIHHSTKMMILMSIVTACIAIKDKLLIFSRSIPTLDYIARCLTEFKIEYFRLDGQTKIADRQYMIDAFNGGSTKSVFLVSINSGSLGVNMIAANRVVLVDLGWNPSHDEQAVARAYRYGQVKPVYVYRLQNFGTWEDKVYKNNIHKIGLAYRVVDERNPDKHFTRKEISTYFTLPPLNVPTYLDEKTFDDEDIVLANVLKRYTCLASIMNDVI
ncbi:P-loop containing nucleoside triphosphate hydrolase protein [Syncephalis plumigaleata]|nr:P-loop containing nucleoside triphosphate hydrolase protein [Syncephalis plumigaleata]